MPRIETRKSQIMCIGIAVKVNGIRV